MTDPLVRAPLWVAHHYRDQLDRCVLLPWGRASKLAVCARCLGLYPTLVATLIVQVAVLGAPGYLGAADWLITIGLSAPAVFDWGLSRLGRPGTNPGRILTGVALGVGLGRGFLFYFRDTAAEIFWVQALAIGIGALAFEMVARIRRP